MSFEILDNPKATRVKRAAALAKKKERIETGRFLVEGPQAVRELLTHSANYADVVYATTGGEPWQFEIDRLASDAGIDIVRVTRQVLSAMAETVQPQGVIAVARIPEFTLDEALNGAKLVAVLHEVRDPGNAGTVLRAADAAGADAVIFSGDSIDPWHPKVVRSTTGSVFHLPVVADKSLESVVSAVRKAGLEPIAADVRGASLTDARADLAGPIAWVFGNEARGLGEGERSIIGRSLKLPIYGAAESLNLATAASVLLYETAFSQRATP